MNLKIVTLLLFACLFVKLSAQDRQFESRLPIVFIETNGVEIVDEPKRKARMEIIWKGDGVLNKTSDPKTHFNGNIRIEIRGSSSQMFPKKSYGFELQSQNDEDMDFPLLGMPEEEDWILYAPYTDKTLIRNVLALTLAARNSSFYVPRCKFVELFVNGKYHGVYVLMEKIKRDKNRIDISRLKEEDTTGEQLTGGYIIKIDKLTGNPGEGWHSEFTNQNNSRTYYQYEYPKVSEIQPAQKQYIKNYVNNFESAIYDAKQTGGDAFLELMNPESFFDCVLINELSKNVDAYRLSMFLHKDKAGKLNAGSLWDYNLSFGNANYYHGWEPYGLFLNEDLGQDHWQIPFWWKELIKSDHFVNPLKCKWEELRTKGLSFSSINTVIDSLTTHLGDAVYRNFERWPIMGEWIWPNYYVGNNYESEIDWMKNWITDRVRQMDFIIPGTCGAVPVQAVENFSFTIFPVPFISHLNLIIESKFTVQYRFELYAIEGQKVNEIPISVEPGINTFKINTANVKAGVYVYRMMGGDNKISQGRIIKL